MVTRGEKGIWSPSQDAPYVFSPVHICVENWLGCTCAGSNGSGGVDRGGTLSLYQCFVDEGSSDGLDYLQGLHHGRVHCPDERQCHSDACIKKQGGTVS